MRDMLDNPLYRPEHLGLRIPDDPFAISVCLPRWKDCVGFERGDPNILTRLQGGYPRFFLHPAVKQLFEDADPADGRDEHTFLVLSSYLSAKRCSEYIGRRAGVDPPVISEVSEEHGAWAVIVDAENMGSALEYWQHTGEGVSARCAEAIVKRRSIHHEAGKRALRGLRVRLSQWYRCPLDNVFCFPSGMAAAAAIVRVLARFAPNRRTLQLGFPYVDVFKVQKVFGLGGELIGDTGRHSLEAVRSLVATEDFAGCFVELPGNPLLTSVDVIELCSILRPKGCPVVVDDTLSGPYNVDIMQWGDLVFSSLTKFITGCGTVTGGVIICPSASPFSEELRGLLESEHEESVWWEDAVVLEKNSRDYTSRIESINSTTRNLVSWLEEHSLIAKLAYPDRVDRTAYELVKRPKGGYGGVFSLELEDATSNTELFYDALPVCKGPSLGTNFTLCCPVTILAHYNELEWAESHGVSRNLIRFSIGLENLDVLKERFLEAFRTLDG